MNQQKEIIKKTQKWVRSYLEKDATGHDWWHIERVRQMALHLASLEGANSFICEMAALLHDMTDEKLELGLDRSDVESWLEDNGVLKEECQQIVTIISQISYKNSLSGQERLTLEGQIVQDADRLDALGAIGIARTMAYSGSKQRVIHDPKKQVREYLTAESYRNGEDTAILHMYEKLLKLKDLMNTETARQLAEKRYDFMLLYLEQFFMEWQGKD